MSTKSTSKPKTHAPKTTPDVDIPHHETPEGRLETIAGMADAARAAVEEIYAWYLFETDAPGASHLGVHPARDAGVLIHDALHALRIIDRESHIVGLSLQAGAQLYREEHAKAAEAAP